MAIAESALKTEILENAIGGTRRIEYASSGEYSLSLRGISR